MDVPLALNDIGILEGFKGSKRKSSTIYQQADVEGLSALYTIYYIKSRGLDQLRDVALYSNEIHNLEKYINLISDDRKRAILISIFIERRDYEVVCSELKITEVQFKKIKKDAIRDIKQLIFRAKK